MDLSSAADNLRAGLLDNSDLSLSPRTAGIPSGETSSHKTPTLKKPAVLGGAERKEFHSLDVDCADSLIDGETEYINEDTSEILNALKATYNSKYSPPPRSARYTSLFRSISTSDVDNPYAVQSSAFKDRVKDLLSFTGLARMVGVGATFVVFFWGIYALCTKG